MTTYVMDRYPKEAALARSGATVTVRPLEVGDARQLLEFFRRVPEEDRFFLKEDVALPEVINGWVRHMDFNRALPLVAVSKGEIVADATLHWSRSRSRKHKGEIRVVVDPRYRDQGLGTLMAIELIDIACLSGLHGVFFELVEAEEEHAIRTAESLGFTTVATLPGFVLDPDGETRDLVVMELLLEDWPES